MYVTIAIHHPKGSAEERTLLQAMKRFVEAQRGHKGLMLVTAAKDELAALSWRWQFGIARRISGLLVATWQRLLKAWTSLISWHKSYHSYYDNSILTYVGLIVFIS